MNNCTEKHHEFAEDPTLEVQVVYCQCGRLGKTTGGHFLTLDIDTPEPERVTIEPDPELFIQ